MVCTSRHELDAGGSVDFTHLLYPEALHALYNLRTWATMISDTWMRWPRRSGADRSLDLHDEKRDDDMLDCLDGYFGFNL